MSKLKLIYVEHIAFQHYDWTRDLDYSREEPSELDSETVKNTYYVCDACVEARYLNDHRIRLGVITILPPPGLDFDEVMKATDAPIETRELCIDQSEAQVIRRAVAIADTLRIALENSSPMPASMVGEQRPIVRDEADTRF